MIKPDTKQIFADALVELCKTKPLEKITVQNIVDYCEAGRQTFYNHFKDKEDLVAYVFILDEKKCREKLEKNCSIEEKLGVILNTFVEKSNSTFPHIFQAARIPLATLFLNIILIFTQNR